MKHQKKKRKHNYTAQTHLHYMTKSMWAPACRTSHSKIMGINMDLLIKQPPLFWEGFPLDVGTLLWRLGVTIHPKVVQWG
jgi:hypothetical protein